jgi:hypothetical protein
MRGRNYSVGSASRRILEAPKVANLMNSKSLQLIQANFRRPELW